LTASVLALGYRPVRLAPFAIIVALVAAGLAKRNSKLAGFAVAIASLSWLLGMTIAVLLSKPIY
jgi:hypothetical protein